MISTIFELDPIAPETIPMDTWVKASWDSFLALVDDPAYKDGRFYYQEGYLRIEMAALGPAHARDNTTVANVVTLYALIKNIRIGGYTNCSFWKPGIRTSQPDTAFYLGAEVQFPPRSNQAVDVSVHGAPHLVIEVGSASFKDDLGAKRLLYEQLGVLEYWVVDVAETMVYAFEVNQGWSGRIQESRVLTGLSIAIVEAALKRSQTEDDSTVNRWLMETINTLS
jgi:Uma2 family endonuclease